MSRNRVARLLFGSADAISSTVYGSIVVMATVAAGSRGADTDAGELAALLSVTVLVLWFAHVYAHALGSSIKTQQRLRRKDVLAVARRELAILFAGVGAVSALVLAELGVLRPQTAIRLALAIGILTLAVEGVRYATIERLSRSATAAVVVVNVLLGLVIVVLEALVSH